MNIVETHGRRVSLQQIPRGFSPYQLARAWVRNNPGSIDESWPRGLEVQRCARLSSAAAALGARPRCQPQCRRRAATFVAPRP